MTIQQVIDKLLTTYDPLPFANSCDGFKFGDPTIKCTGIATSCALTPNVIKAVARKGCNLIIVHEPSFYTHGDDTDWLVNNDVFRQKTQLMREHNIAVWRNHDHMHHAKTDEIMAGVLEELGWKEYVDKEDFRFRLRITIPKTTVRALGEHLRSRLNLRTGRFIGDPDAEVSHIAFCGHIFPSWNAEERKPTELLNESDVDVLIPGELFDWSVVTYARDAAELHIPKAIMQVGHFNLEEPGMRYLAKKVAQLFPELPVHYTPSGDPYFFV